MTASASAFCGPWSDISWYWGLRRCPGPRYHMKNIHYDRWPGIDCAASSYGFMWNSLIMTGDGVSIPLEPTFRRTFVTLE